MKNSLNQIIDAIYSIPHHIFNAAVWVLLMGVYLWVKVEDIFRKSK